MQPRGKNKEVVSDSKPLGREADARRRLGEVGHVEGPADVAFPNPVNAEGHVTGTDVRNCSTEYNLRHRFCFIQRHGDTFAG